MSGDRPNVILFGGPNGAGKSTLAPVVLRDLLDVLEYVDADAIARGLSAYASDAAGVAAGRVMIERLRDLAERRCNFAFETTLASRSPARRIEALRDVGYRTHLVYVWLPDPAESIERVAARVRRGGHDIPETTVRRRHARSQRNLLSLYLPLADHWRVYDNSCAAGPRLTAYRLPDHEPTILDADAWRALSGQAPAP